MWEDCRTTPECSFHQQGDCKLVNTFKLVEKAGGEPKKRHNSVTKTLDHTQAGKATLFKFIAKPSVRCLSDSSETNFYRTLRNHVVEKFRLFRAAERLSKSAKSEVTPSEFYNMVDKAVEVRMLCRTRNSEFVKSFSKQTWHLHSNRYEVEGAYLQACDKVFRPSSSTTQEKVVASRSDFDHEDRAVIVDSGVSFHVMSKNEITSGEKETIRKSQEPTHRHHDRQR